MGTGFGDLCQSRLAERRSGSTSPKIRQQVGEVHRFDPVAFGEAITTVDDDGAIRLYVVEGDSQRPVDRGQAALDLDSIVVPREAWCL